MNVQLAHEPFPMRFNRAESDIQLAGDFVQCLTGFFGLQPGIDQRETVTVKQ